MSISADDAHEIAERLKRLADRDKMLTLREAVAAVDQQTEQWEGIEAYLEPR